MTYFILLTLALATSAASALHGGNWLSKGVIIAGHALLCCLALLALGATWQHSALGLIPSAMFWFLYRTGEHADAEMVAMEYPNHKHRMEAVREYIVPMALTSAAATFLLIIAKAWLALLVVPLFWLFLGVPYAALCVWNYETDTGKRLLEKYAGKSQDRTFDNRRFTEISTGLAPCGVGVSLLLFAIHLALGAFHVVTI